MILPLLMAHFLSPSALKHYILEVLVGKSCINRNDSVSKKKKLERSKDYFCANVPCIVSVTDHLFIYSLN